MNREVSLLVQKVFGEFGNDKNCQDIIAMFIEDIMKHENVSVDEITRAGKGATSRNLKIGNYVLKVGEGRFTEKMKNSPRILQPIIRRKIPTSSGNLFIEVQNAVNADWYKGKIGNIYNVLYQVYKDLREDGLLWTDVKFSNVGKLLKDNRVYYDTKVHDENGNIIRKEIEPSENATNLKGRNKSVLKKGEFVLIDTDCVFDVDHLPEGRTIENMLTDTNYENLELRYQREKREIEKSR